MIFGSLSKKVQKYYLKICQQTKNQIRIVMKNFQISYSVKVGEFYRVKLYCNRIFPYYSYCFHFGEIQHKMKSCWVDYQFQEKQLKLLHWCDLKRQHSVIVVQVSSIEHCLLLDFIEVSVKRYWCDSKREQAEHSLQPKCCDPHFLGWKTLM